jgi:predicted nucleotidyltransferase component of viral defense system
VKPLRSRLDAARRRSGLPWEVLERDYLLSWLLAGIDQTPLLRESLVFKGGTALKKCFFGDYRFSEDLDFSGLPGVPTGEAMEQAIRGATATAAGILNDHTPVTLTCERYTEKEPHPGGQEAFAIRAQLPWHRQPQARVIIEVCVDERVLKPAARKPILHEYGEPLEASVSVYALEEIIAEKLRAILQHIEKLESRGWSRSRARDYYDLWRVLSAYNNQLDLVGFPDFLHEKCAVRNVEFTNSADFFQNKMLAYVEKTWEQWLGPLVPQLPSFQTVIGELTPKIQKLVD